MATALQFANEYTVDIPRESQHARVIARFFFACFWTIVFTGAIRKWMFPGVSVLYLTQDVPIGCAYLYALWSGRFNRGFLMLGIALLSAIIILQCLAQIIFSGLEVFVALAGIHNYLFYLPMLLIFPFSLTLKYRKNFVWWNLMLSIPMCLLTVAQAKAPKQSWVNRTSEGDAFGVSGSEIARTTGTFNFSSFFGIWVAIAVALCVGEWLLPKHRRSVKKQWLLVLCTFTVNLCHLISGSRGTIALAGAGIVGGMVGAVVLRSSRAIIALAGICFLLPVAAGMTYVLSPDEFNIVKERFTGDQYVEGGKQRLTDNFIGFATVPKFSLIGAGLGMGVDAAHFGNSDSYNFTYQLSEVDIIRNVMELGSPVGLLYVLTRILFCLGMVLLAIRLVRIGSSPHVLPLAFYLVAQVYLADMTRSAAMSASQAMIGFSFILGTYYHPDNSSLEISANDSLTRSV